MKKFKGFAIHTLANGETVCITSAHGFKFSDGTEAVEGADPDIAKTINVSRGEEIVKENVVRSSFSMTDDVLNILSEINSRFDWVIVPVMVLQSLREMGLRNNPRFSNIVGINATPETKRAKPNEKIVDITRWAW